MALHEGLAFRPSDEAGVADVTLSKSAMPPLKLLAEQFRRSYLQEQDECVLSLLIPTKRVLILVLLDDLNIYCTVLCLLIRVSINENAKNDVIATLPYWTCQPTSML